MLRLNNALAQSGDKFGIGENVESFEQFGQVGIAEGSDHRNTILSNDDGFVGQFTGEVGELLLCLGDRELFGHSAGVYQG